MRSLGPAMSTRGRLLLSYIHGATLTHSEAVTAWHGFKAFACVLASYFILLPLREDVALTLGPRTLPALFTVSLGVTAVAAPLVTAYIVNPTSSTRARGFRRLCRVMAGALLVLCVLLLTVSERPWGPQHAYGHPAHPPSPEAVAVQRSWYGTGVRAAFYVYLSLQSLLSTSTMWAVCADTFSAATSTRVYGLLGAGATLGQLVASATALAYGTACRRLGLQGGAVWLLPFAAGLLLLAARSCQDMVDTADLLGQAGSGHGAHHHQQHHAQGSAAHGSENGLGSATHGAQRLSGGGGGGGGSSSVGGEPGALGGGGGGGVARAERAPSGGFRGAWRRLSRSPFAAHASRLAEGFTLIAASPYLLAACAFLALNYSVSATLYFVRAAVVSRDGALADSGARIAFFAALNTASAGLIFTAQLLVTGRALSSLGVGGTLCVGPLVSLAGMAAIHWSPATATIAGVEVLRKVVQYALARPCREVLFTVVSRNEKYTAKVVLDTVVQRLGDTAAAAMFEVVGNRMALGPAAVATLGAALCAAHLAVSLALGRMYGVRKAAAAAQAKKEQQRDVLHTL